MENSFFLLRVHEKEGSVTMEKHTDLLEKKDFRHHGKEDGIIF